MSTPTPPSTSTSSSLLHTLRTLAPPSSPPKSIRPAHAKGALLTGSFTPNPSSTTPLTTAPHLTTLPSSKITLRFSSSTGIPDIPDTSASANPRGIALRFHLPDEGGKRRHTDVIAHSTPLFPSRTGEDFLAFLRAAGSGDEARLSQYLDENSAAKRFVAAAKPSPASFARERYYSVNAVKFVNKEGEGRFVRYRVEPTEPYSPLSAEEVEKLGAEYLREDLRSRFSGGEGEIKFKLLAQLANEGDVVDDATVVWGDEEGEREIVELGEICLERLVEGDEKAEVERRIIFDPVPRVEGIESSGDPLLEVRASVYLESGRDRRAGGEGKA